MKLVAKNVTNATCPPVRGHRKRKTADDVAREGLPGYTKKQAAQHRKGEKIDRTPSQLMNEMSNLDLVFEGVSRFGVAAIWPIILKEIPKTSHNSVLSLIPSVEASLNFTKRFKYVMMIDENTGLTQGPYRKDEVKLPMRRSK